MTTHALLANWANDPAGWLRDALAMLALQWDAHTRALLFDGEGLGLGWITAALRRLLQAHDAHVVEECIAGSALHAFRFAYLDRLGPGDLAVVVALVERRRVTLATVAPHTRRCDACALRYHPAHRAETEETIAVGEQLALNAGDAPPGRAPRCQVCARPRSPIIDPPQQRAADRETADRRWQGGDYFSKD